MSVRYVIPSITTGTPPTAGYANGLMTSSVTAVDTSAAAAPTLGQVLTASGSSAASWVLPVGQLFVGTSIKAGPTNNVEASIVPSGNGSMTYTPVANDVLRIMVFGYLRSNATSGGVCGPRLYKGSTLLADGFTGTNAFPSTSSLDTPWHLQVDFCFRSTTSVMCNSMMFTTQTTANTAYTVRGFSTNTSAVAVSAAAEAIDLTWTYTTNPNTANADIHVTDFLMQLIRAA